MPSILGKRKRGSALDDHPPGHGNGGKLDARKAIVRTVEEQIGLERGLKMREIQATEARIAWARAVGEGIERGKSVPSLLDPSSVRVAALYSYWSIGSAYYSWPRPQPPTTAQDGADFGVPRAPPPPPVDFPPLSDELRASVQQTIAKGSKPLLVKYVVDPRSEPVLVLLVCPVCKRVDLSTVQGFYNHCRLAHQLSYAGHSECIEAGGHLVSREDVQSIGLDDVEIKGTGIPSIQRLFQRAVGMQPSAPQPSQQPADQEPSASLSVQHSPSPAPVDTDLNKALGLHDETPALAQFLGTTAKRRQIKVFDPGEPIDILTPAPEPRRFRFLYRSRRGIPPTQEGMDDAVPLAFIPQVPAMGGVSPDIPDASIPSSSAAAAAAAANPGEKQSRFHISRRIIIADRSRYIPLSRRGGNVDAASHEWSLTITAPSYMPHISTFLQSATITAPSPSPNTPSQSQTFTDSPFTAHGKSSSPFLASIHLHWAGSQQNKPTSTTHWVQLDAGKSGGWVGGDEQVLDVQLDKETVFLPVREDTGRQKRREAEERAEAAASAAAVEEQDKGKGKPKSLLEETLARLLPSYPLTLQDVKGKKAPQVPYTLPTSRRKFLSFTLGRQRAVEWQRARCLRLAAQDELLKESAFDLRASLTTGAVLEWLRERSGVRRAPIPEPKPKASPGTNGSSAPRTTGKQGNNTSHSQEVSFPGIGFMEAQYSSRIRPIV